MNTKPECFHTFSYFHPQTQAENGCEDCKVKRECFSCDMTMNNAQQFVEKTSRRLFEKETKRYFEPKEQK